MWELNHASSLSTGEVFSGAKSYRKLEAKLSRLQYLNRHKTKFSNNWRAAQLKIARLHTNVANIRKDTLHKLTTYVSLESRHDCHRRLKCIRNDGQSQAI
ncbi:MAG: transposase [Trichodesmium sp. MO_231.B1]|nr:transposase [Trichodesmium sp. MO_231.B1]